MVRRTKEEAQATRDQLLDTAIRLFSEQGVASTTLGQIATTAGLTRGAIYWHFADKADLLTALGERILTPVRGALACIDARFPDAPLERLREKACWMADHVESDPLLRDITTILMLRCEFAEETRGTIEHFTAERERRISQLSADAAAAQAAGQLPASARTEEIALGLLALTDGLLFHWLSMPTRFAISPTTRSAVGAYIEGIRHSS